MVRQVFGTTPSIRARSIFDDFDEIFNFPFRDFPRLTSALSPPRRLRELVSSDFPPTNITINTKTHQYKIDVALAGVPEDAISISTEGRIIQLEVNISETEDDGNTYTAQQGIKEITNLKSEFFIDKRWDIESISAQYSNGLLTITLDPKEGAPSAEKKKIALNKPNKSQIESKPKPRPEPFPRGSEKVLSAV